MRDDPMSRTLPRVVRGGAGQCVSGGIGGTAGLRAIDTGLDWQTGMQSIPVSNGISGGLRAIDTGIDWQTGMPSIPVSNGISGGLRAIDTGIDW